MLKAYCNAVLVMSIQVETLVVPAENNFLRYANEKLYSGEIVLINEVYPFYSTLRC